MTIAAGDLIIVTWTGELAGTAPAPAVSTTLTSIGAFTQVGSASDANFHASSAWWALATGASTGTITVTIATQGTMRHTLRTSRVNGGVNTGAPIRQSNNSAGNFVANPSVTLASAPLATNLVFGFCHIESNTAVTAAGSGFALVGTQLVNPNLNESDTCEANTAPSSTTVGFTTAYANWSNIVACEVAAAAVATFAAAARTITRRRAQWRRRGTGPRRYTATSNVPAVYTPAAYSSASRQRRQAMWRRRGSGPRRTTLPANVPAAYLPTAYVFPPRKRSGQIRRQVRTAAPPIAAVVVNTPLAFGTAGKMLRRPYPARRVVAMAPYGGRADALDSRLTFSSTRLTQPAIRRRFSGRIVTGPPLATANTLPPAASSSKPRRSLRSGRKVAAPVPTPTPGPIPAAGTSRRAAARFRRGIVAAVRPPAVVVVPAPIVPAARSLARRRAQRLFRQLRRFIPGGAIPIVSYPGPIIGDAGTSELVGATAGVDRLVLAEAGADVLVFATAGVDPLVSVAAGADLLVT